MFQSWGRADLQNRSFLMTLYSILIMLHYIFISIQTLFSHVVISLCPPLFDYEKLAHPCSTRANREVSTVHTKTCKTFSVMQSAGLVFAHDCLWAKSKQQESANKLHLTGFQRLGKECYRISQPSFALNLRKKCLKSSQPPIELPSLLSWEHTRGNLGQSCLFPSSRRQSWINVCHLHSLYVV